MNYQGLQRLLPGPIRRHVLFFESRLEDAVDQFARKLPQQARLLDAGAGESRFAAKFASQRYVGVDLAVGDVSWNYTGLDTLADLSYLPFADSTFDAALNVVTLEHVPEPARVLGEIARVLRPGAPLLLIAPHEWEEHQQPHDYYRYTRYGLRHLLTRAGFRDIDIQPVGGFFRLLSRRMLNAAQFFPGLLAVVAAALIAPAALLTPLLEPMDRTKHFTLGFICTARKS